MSIFGKRIRIDRFILIVKSLASLGMTFMLASCAIVSRHQFAEPAQDWQVRSGQLLYRNPRTTLIGDVLVRFSRTGDFELTFSKGPGLTLLTIRQDASSAAVKGAFARMGWSGPVERAPKQLRGWLQLREKLIHSQVRQSDGLVPWRDRQSIRHTAGGETFVFRF
jgi:hypothetical protein